MIAVSTRNRLSGWLKLATPEVAVEQMMLYYQRSIVNTFVAGDC
jgi:hypothetical protein